MRAETCPFAAPRQAAAMQDQSSPASPPSSSPSTAAPPSPTSPSPTVSSANCAASRWSGWTTATPQGVEKRALVAHRGPKGGYALSGHMDTVPDTGWQQRSLVAADRPRRHAARARQRRHEGRGRRLHRGGEVGPGACPGDPADHHRRGNDQGRRPGRSRPAPSPARSGLKGIVVAEPTGLIPVRGHRSSSNIVATARGRAGAFLDRHRATNANWALIPFLVGDAGDPAAAAAATRRCRMPPTTRPSATSTWSSTTTARR